MNGQTNDQTNATCCMGTKQYKTIKLQETDVPLFKYKGRADTHFVTGQRDVKLILTITPAVAHGGQGDEAWALVPDYHLEKVVAGLEAWGYRAHYVTYECLRE